MSWAIGFDSNWDRDIGYGVPAKCDHPECGADIDRGLSYVCGNAPQGGNHGCGLYFCADHLRGYRHLCAHCEAEDGLTFEPTRDTLEWVKHKMTHPSWARYREDNPEWVEQHKEYTP